MIKALKIASIGTAAIAVLFLVFSVVYGTRQDKEKVTILAQPGIIEKFKANAGKKSDADAPLVKQAQTLALRINPPKPVEKPDIEKIRPPIVQFKLIGTSYNSREPSRSIALIDEPGAGWRWVSKSDKIGSVVVEDIVDGKLVYSEAGKTHEMLVEHSSQIPTLMSTIVAPSTPSQPSSVPPVTAAPTKEQVKENVEFVKKIMADVRDPNKAGMSAEEAADLGELGDFLKKVEAEAAAQGVDANAVPPGMVAATAPAPVLIPGMDANRPSNEANGAPGLAPGTVVMTGPATPVPAVSPISPNPNAGATGVSQPSRSSRRATSRPSAADLAQARQQLLQQARNSAAADANNPARSPRVRRPR